MFKIDLHCDVLYKLETMQHLHFHDADRLDVTPTRLQAGDVRLQCFAIFVSSGGSATFSRVLHQIELFHAQVLTQPNIVHVQTVADIQRLYKSGKTGAMLTLEGVDALAGDLSLLRHLVRLGVRMIGITWNDANWAADGVMEPRQGTFTQKGREFLYEAKRLGLILDVAHLCAPAFWELYETRIPLIASHANAYSVCPHPRNLDDEQIRALIQQQGLLGLTFVPQFLRSDRPANMTDLLHHIEHVCTLGGVRQIGFGSDFDGIDEWTEGLEHAGKYESLANLLLKHYNEDEVKGFMWENAHRFLIHNMPQ